MANNEMTPKRQYILERAIRDIKKYATDQDCSIQDAFADWVSEEPTQSWLIDAICAALSVKTSQRYTDEEYAEYVSEQYGEY